MPVSGKPGQTGSVGFDWRRPQRASPTGKKMTPGDKKHIAFGKKLAYAAPAFALAVVGIPVYVYIPKFYSDVVGVNITVIGYILFSVRIFDALTDPAIGYLSDRATTRFGRRRPFISGGAILVAVAMLMLFIPPSASTVNM